MHNNNIFTNPIVKLNLIAMGLLSIFPLFTFADKITEDAQEEIQLETIRVTALIPSKSYPGNLINRHGLTGVLGYVDYMNNPFNVTSYSANAIEHQQSRNISDSINKYDASINTSGNDSAQKTYMSIRGFLSDPDDTSLNGLPGMAGYFKIPTNGVAIVEFIKGPSTALTGSSISGSVSGNINIITKKAPNDPIAELGFLYHTHSRTGLFADLATRLGPDKQWGIRYNGEFSKGNGVRERQKEKNVLNSLTLDFRSDKLRFSVDAMLNNINQNGVNGTITSFAGNHMISVDGKILPPPNGKNNLDQLWTYQNIRNRMVMSKVEWDITDDIMAYAAIGHAKHEFLAKNNVYSLVSKIQKPAAELGSYHSTITASPINIKNITSMELGINGKSSLGFSEHKWNISTNLSNFKDRITSDFYLPDTSCTSFTIYDVHSCEPFSGTPLMHVDRNIKGKLFSFAIADSISLWQDKLQLTLGLRHQRIESQDIISHKPKVSKTGISPAIGVVFKPMDDLSIYSSYIEGLAKGGTAPVGTSNFGEELDPYKAKQLELGIKKNFGNILASVAVFQIEKNTSLLVGPPPSLFTDGGEQRNRGLELNLFGEPMNGLRLNLSNSWIKAKRIKYNQDTFSSTTALPVHEFTTKLNLEWDLPYTNQLTLLSSINYTGKATIDGRDFYTNQIVATKVPARTRLDLGLLWTSNKLLGKKTTLQLNIENVLNKKYWSIAGEDGSIFLNHAEPRTILFSAKVSF